MVELIHDIKERTGAAIAIVEHDIPMIRSLSDEVVCMHLGEVIARGRPDDVLADSTVISSYLGFDDVAVARSGRLAAPARSTARRGRPAAARARPRKAGT